MLVDDQQLHLDLANGKEVLLRGGGHHLFLQGANFLIDDLQHVKVSFHNRVQEQIHQVIRPGCTGMGARTLEAHPYILEHIAVCITECDHIVGAEEEIDMLDDQLILFVVDHLHHHVEELVVLFYLGPMRWIPDILQDQGVYAESLSQFPQHILRIMTVDVDPSDEVFGDGGKGRDAIRRCALQRVLMIPVGGVLDHLD